MITAAAATVVRLSGLIREIIFAAFFGAGMAADAYNAAFRAAQFFRELVAEGSLSNAYIPIFSRVAEEEGKDAAFRLANAFLGVLLLALGGITLLTFALAEGWIWLVAAGYATDPEKFALSVDLTRLLSPFVACMSLAAVFMGMLNVQGRFFLPSVAPAAFNVAVMLACFVAEPLGAWMGQPPIVIIALASLVGGAAQFLVQLPALWAEGFRLRPRLERHPALRSVFSFLIPAFIGITTVQFSLLVESQLASRFGDGPVSHLFYAFRLVQIPVSVVAGSVAVAALVQLSALVARRERHRLAAEIGDALTLNTFLVLPASVGLFLLADPLIALTFERGAFSAADTRATAQMLQMYALATWGICTHRLALPCYYALGDPYFPMRLAVGLMILKLPVALALVYPLGLGPAGLPLSHALLVTAECALLWWGFTQRAGPFDRTVYSQHARILLASAGMGVLTWLLLPYAQGLGVLAVTAAGAAAYFALATVLRISAARRVLDRLLRPRRHRGLPPTVDAETRAALEALAAHAAQAQLQCSAAGLRVLLPDGGEVFFQARGGLLVGSVRTPTSAAPAGGGAPVGVGAVMRVGQGPPMLHGLVVGARAFRARDEAVLEERAPGPVIPITG